MNLNKPYDQNPPKNVYIKKRQNTFVHAFLVIL